VEAGRRVVVVGGGISGLVTAYFLSRGNEPVPLRITLVEGEESVGGKIRTETVGGFSIDAGPDAILARSPRVVDLITDLGLLDDVSRPASRRAYVWTRGQLRPLPPMSLFGVPETPVPLLRSRVLSPWGALRAGADFVLPRQQLPPDPTISDLLRPRFGGEVFDQLIDPLLGGVHAGRADRLSARSAVPEVYLAARSSRSTYLAMRRREAPTSRGLGMISLRGGLQRLVDALVEAMPQVEIRTGAPLTRIERDGFGWWLHTDSGEPIGADSVVLATPAPVTAQLLAEHSTAAADALRDIPYIGVATVMLVYPRSAIGRPLDGTGFLVPPRAGRMIVGATWSTAKWDHLLDEETAVLRCAVGRHGDTRWELMPDTELVRRVHEELSLTMRLGQQPSETVVRRWPGSMPQYTVGHERRLVTVARELGDLPGLHVTGAAYRGVGISGCIAQASGVADAVTAQWDGMAGAVSRTSTAGGQR
jgi:oxygen-dependent protoporphyrinogen oxidase